MVMPEQTYSKPSEVVAVEGKVLVDGPDHVHFAFTPEAAAETGARLIDQAALADVQLSDQPDSS